ncbi:MAG: Ni/Fe-hydrogenase cytochrome b subunit, partial [Chloroflexi bacterium]
MNRFPKLTVWRTIFALLALAGLYSTYLRVFYGLGAVTNLTDEFPWGIWIGFDILCGVGLAAGGFTLVAVVHIFNIERYKPILRPSILTAFLGYTLVCLALLFDLGRPDRIWHPLVMWNPHSVMFEVAWCVTLYTTVLALEFVPVVFERFGMERPLSWIKFISVPLMIAGVILSTLHQSSLGSLYLIVPHKLDALWYTPLLPVFFYVSAICAGLAMTIFESWHSSRAFGRALELPLLASIARVLAVLLSVYLMLRFIDLRHRGALPLVIERRPETWLFWLEICLMLLPMLLLFRAHVRRRPGALYACAVMVVFGFVTNRLNVSITGMEAGSGAHYVPRWTEVA